MKLISTNSSLKSQLARLISEYPNIAFGVAWASAGTDIFAGLVHGRNKIHSGVIGTHFFQTHPDVLDEFVGSDVVKFVLQPEGVFHPKVFAFWDDKSWEILIGSANLTAGALTVNTELSALISNTDGDSGLMKQVLNLIHGYGSFARSITKDEADNYRRIWKLKQPVVTRLGGKYGLTASIKPAVDSPVMCMSWEQFYKRIQQDETHGFIERCNLLKMMNAEFIQTKHFKDMDLQIRLGIAGLRSTVKNAQWFGSMVGSGYFYQAVNENNPYLSSALDKIPLDGPVTQTHFEAFISDYLKVFPNGRDGIGTASRLLALKRPDTFVCVDSKNQALLAKDFGIKKSGLDYERYWSEIIERIMDAPWWKGPEPSNTSERDAWRGRVAMLDAIFYEQ